MTQDTISHLRRLAEAASAGPWRSHAGTMTVNNGKACLADCDQFFDEIENRRNADYIAAVSPQVILALLKRLEAAEKVVLATRRMDVPVMADALIAYDQAIAADGDKGGK
jgi:hypothetical protein